MSTDEPKLFLTKGMTIDISSFEISIDENGRLSSPGPTIHTGLEMCPYWLEIAFDHLLKTEVTHKTLLTAVTKKDELSMGILLQQEFVLGMQVVMASCIAIDSYYASIKKFANIPDELLKTWKSNRTVRYTQIAETIKRVFVIPQDVFQQIREMLKQSFKLRDRAVHPKYGTDVTVLYPEINKITDWRFSAFRYANAKAVVGNSLSLIFQTSKQKTEHKEETQENYFKNLSVKVEPTYEKWTNKYGKLFG